MWHKGKVLYTNLCLRCHGVDGKGDAYMKFNPPVADLSAPAVQSKLDGALMKAIHDGRKDSAMGAWKFVLSDEEIRDVTPTYECSGVTPIASCRSRMEGIA
jgi:mono/diheme cytochrome c family protein